MAQDETTKKYGWVRIPVSIDSEQDLRTLASILVCNGLEVRTISPDYYQLTPRNYIEYRENTSKTVHSV